MSISQALRQARLAHGIQQTFVADRIGVSRAFMWAIEAGHRPLPEKYIPLLPEPIRMAVVAAMRAEHEAAIRRLQRVADA